MQLIKKTLPFQPELIICDFDGVLTDNRVYIDENGIESVVCSRSDGMAIDFLRKTIPFFILSTEPNNVVVKRAKKLQIECLNGLSDKKEALLMLCKSRDINLKRVVYIGNDINDLDAMNICGYSVAPSDAHLRVLTKVDHVLGKQGGDGVIREFCEVFLGM